MRHVDTKGLRPKGVPRNSPKAVRILPRRSPPNEGGSPDNENRRTFEDYPPAADPRPGVIFDVGRSTSWPRRRCDSACWTPPHEIQGGETPVSARFDVRSRRRRYRVLDERVPGVRSVAGVGCARLGSTEAGNLKILGRPPTCGRPAARGGPGQLSASSKYYSRELLRVLLSRPTLSLKIQGGGTRVEPWEDGDSNRPRGR